jgi:uncharacterized protein (DUF427 family)
MSQPSRRTEDPYSSLRIGPLVEPSPRWVRVRFGGEIIADSKHVLLLRHYGPGRLPTYYFPREDVRMDVLKAVENKDPSIRSWNVEVNGRIADNAAWSYVNPSTEMRALKDYVSFEWNAMDAWMEEEEEVFVHARDPYKRVDVLKSSRHVRVIVDGQQLAETHEPRLLFETGLPVRYYIPRKDVRVDLLEPTDHSSRCPYKGVACYWSVRSGGRTVENIVWSYPDPIAEIPGIKDLMCFFNERADIYVDGDLQRCPVTPWSS